MVDSGDRYLEKEISCRTTNAIIEYVKWTGQSIETLLDGLPLDAEYLSDTNNWVSLEFLQILHERLIRMYNDNRIMFRVGQSVSRLRSAGIMEYIALLVGDPKNFIRRAAKYAKLFAKVMDIRVLDIRDGEATIEYGAVSGYKLKKPSCDYTQGLFSAITDKYNLGYGQIEELKCSMAIEELPPTGGFFYRRKGEYLYKYRVGDNPEIDEGELVGPFNSDGSIQIGTVIYGTRWCKFRLKWQAKQRRTFVLFSNKKEREVLKDTIRELERNAAIIEEKNDQLEDTLRRLRASEQKYRSLLEDMNDGYFVLRNGKIVYANRTFARMLNREIDEVIELEWEKIVYDSPHVQKEKKLLKDIPEDPFELVLITKNGRKVFVEIKARLTEYEGAEAIAGICRDVTRRKALQEANCRMELELVRQERLSSIGKLIQGIAHNLNSPLTILTNNLLILFKHTRTVLGYIDKIKNKLDVHEYSLLKEELQGIGDRIKRIESSCNKMTDIIKNIVHRTSEEGGLQERWLDINEIIVDELEFLNANIFFKSQVEKRISLNENLPKIKGLRLDLAQMIANLINNALDAMYAVDNPVLIISTSLKDKNILLSVEDNGTGISQKDIEHIFEPFFTTKKQHSTDGSPTGIGLGLFYVHQVVNRYGGRIEVKSKPGKTRFDVYFPIEAKK